MTQNDQNLAHSLKIRFGLAPYEPTNDQINNIKHDISAFTNPTESDWCQIISIYCPGAGSHHYSGVDNSDLNTLLALAISTTK